MTERRIDAAVDIARAEREALRWLLLTALWHARPYGTTESVLLACAHEIPIYATADLIRKELGWLESHGLVKIERERSPFWSAQLTALGEDVYDYRADAPAGLARPPRW
ncbi:cytoplasmic protein [Pelomicrobium methylotrophicum]|uniref:Cytoplasmic protein n=1 Tax=Pelomicrobium methylotrophicum TaxID=2602750 RepID=A0A5C7EXA2_9PROT|nr:cytoplasmic protein [Pelomicrobium methylotrophicum]TXF11914.1 cytoplasmic protein [Pelomicrobium methylotrophicum]